MTQDAPHARPKPSDLEGCHQLIDELFDALDGLRQDRDVAVEEKERLRQEYEELRRWLYGRRRERFDDPGQMKLFETSADAAAAPAGDAADGQAAGQPEETPAATAGRKKKRHGRRRLPTPPDPVVADPRRVSPVVGFRVAMRAAEVEDRRSCLLCDEPVGCMAALLRGGISFYR